jgi:hypothetical protein
MTKTRSKMPAQQIGVPAILLDISAVSHAVIGISNRSLIVTDVGTISIIS